MKNVALVFRSAARCAALLFLVASHSDLRAQATTDAAPSKPTVPEELSPAELLKSYLQVRDQLHATQLAVLSNRVEVEATARVQSASVAEKLDALKVAIAAERERHQMETQRLTAEREREQAESQRWLRTVLWLAAAFGGLGLLAVLIVPLLQWRAMTRMAEITPSRPLLSGPASPGVSLGESEGRLGETVASSNRRLNSVIQRMERRILELEQTALVSSPDMTESHRTDSMLRPPAAVPAKPVFPDPAGSANDLAPNGSATGRTSTGGSVADPAVRVAALLGRARQLASTNQAREAVACYDEILRLDANHPEALVKKGAALERLMRNDEAIRCYDRAIEADRSMTLAYLHKGGVCNRLGRYDEALECYEKALESQEQHS
jgi:hypothetical protein